QSYLDHDPGARFYLLVLDGLPDGEEPGAGVTVVRSEQLGLPNDREMRFKYDVVEYCTAVKPYFLSMILNQSGEEAVVFLDPDILVMRPLIEVKEALASASIVLTPHILTPIPRDGLRPTETDIMISGVYNLGFVALKKSAESAAFLHWWEDRLEDGFRIDVPNGLFTDQKWVDLVPVLFPSTAILRNATYNVAVWNMHEPRIDAIGG